MLLLAHRDPPGLREPAPGRERTRRRRRRQRLRPPVQVRVPQPGPLPLLRRPLPGLRRGRRRLCARGGRRRRPAQALPQGAGRRGPRPRPDPGQCRQPRCPDQRLQRAQPARPAERDHHRPGTGRRHPRGHRLRRGARHRHRPGRPDRADRPHPRVPVRGRGPRHLADRLGQVQHRAPRVRGRHRRTDQGPAAVPAPLPGPLAACGRAQFQHRLRAFPLPRPARAVRLARRGPAAPGRPQLLRRGRRQRAPRPGGVPEPRPGHRRTGG